VDYVGVAPYFGTSVDETFATSNNLENWTDQQYVNYFMRQGAEAEPTHQDIPECLAQIDTIAGIVETATGRTDIPMVTYEMGQHLDSFSFSDTPQRALLRTRWREVNESHVMGFLYQTLNQALIDRGFKYLVAFGGFGGHSDVFYWGTQDNVWGLPYFKRLADIQVNETRESLVTALRFHVFGHSLFTYDGGDAAPATSYTRAGEWLGLLAQHAGLDCTGSFTFGQYTNHNALNWTSGTASDVNVSGTYAIGNDPAYPVSEDYGAISYTHFISMPSNFLEADMGGPPFNRVVTTTANEWETLDDNIDRYHPGIPHLLYVHWPDAGFYAVSSNDTPANFTAYNNDVMGDYLDWHIDLQNELVNRGRTLRTLPVGPVIAWIFENVPGPDGLAFYDVYGDSAPHGDENIYFLAALVCFRAIYGNGPDLSGFSFPGAATQMQSAITSNFDEIDLAVQTRLAYHNANGVRVY
jgi:hypothetical protein